MRSKASYNGHPLHPALIPFPFAFLTGALAFDLAGWVGGLPSCLDDRRSPGDCRCRNALVAAVPGFIDYVYTVPPQSTGKQRATRHMLMNLSAVALFALAWVARRNDAPAIAVVGLELIAVGLLAVGGWMGGVLVSRNQIGVDHRYAAAGKWKEATASMGADGTIVVGDVDELKVNQMKLLHASGRRIVLARDDTGYVVFDDRCPHRGGSLAGGVMICATVHCPWHGSQFDVRSGEVKAGPAKAGIKTYKVEDEDRYFACTSNLISKLLTE